MHENDFSPVDDFARGPEVKFGHENDRWEIRKEGIRVVPIDEILSVLKPYVKKWQEDCSVWGPLIDLYTKLGGVL